VGYQNQGGYAIFFPEFKGGIGFFPGFKGGTGHFSCDLRGGIGNSLRRVAKRVHIEMHNSLNINSRRLKMVLTHL
jgi:hypothetical protein